MMTWREARHHLRDVIAKTEDVTVLMRRAGAQAPPADPGYLKDKNPEVRKLVAALLAIAAVRDCSLQIMQDMLVGLSDSESQVRESIGRAFGACGYAPAIDGLIGLLDNPDEEERHKIGLYLCAMGEAAVPRVLSCLASERSAASHEAASVLSNMGPDVVRWLLNELRHNSVEDWLLSLSVLARFPGEGREALREMLLKASDNSDSVLAAKLNKVSSMFEKLLES